MSDQFANHKHVKAFERAVKAKDLLPFPNRVTVELTNACNLDCVFCPRHFMEDKLSMMKWEVFTKIIDEIDRHPGTAVVPFFRGESLLHKDFLRMMRYIKTKRNVGPIQMTTNAMLLDEKMAQGILDTKLDFLHFSLDTTEKDVYEKVRVRGKFEQVQDNVKRFLRMKEQGGHKLPEVQISMVKTKDTAHIVNDFVKQWQPKVDRVRVFYEHSTDGNFGSWGGPGNPKQLFTKRLPCMKLLFDFVIYCTGEVVLCNHDWDRKEFIGSVAEHSIEEIWNGPKMREIRMRHWEGRTDEDPTCKTCDQWMSYYLPDGYIGELYARKAEPAEQK